jgi:hypothetical protein
MHIAFPRDVWEALEALEQNSHAFEALLALMNSRVRGLTQIVRSPALPTDIAKTRFCRTIVLNQFSILKTLVADGPTRQLFERYPALTYSHQSCSVAVVIDGQSVESGSEFWGADFEPVLTRPAESAVRAVISALVAGRSVGLVGGSGNGKAYVIRSMASFFGRFLYEAFDEGLSIARGILAGGGWVFFRRIDEAAPSALADLVNLAQEERKPSMGLSLFTGRTDLPPGLRQLLRPVTLADRDILATAERCLAAAGYLQSRPLALKMSLSAELGEPTGPFRRLARMIDALPVPEADGEYLQAARAVVYMGGSDLASVRALFGVPVLPPPPVSPRVSSMGGEPKVGEWEMAEPGAIDAIVSSGRRAICVLGPKPARGVQRDGYVVLRTGDRWPVESVAVRFDPGSPGRQLEAPKPSESFAVVGADAEAFVTEFVKQHGLRAVRAPSTAKAFIRLLRQTPGAIEREWLASPPAGLFAYVFSASDRADGILRYIVSEQAARGDLGILRLSPFVAILVAEEESEVPRWLSRYVLPPRSSVVIRKEFLERASAVGVPEDFAGRAHVLMIELGIPEGLRHHIVGSIAESPTTALLRELLIVRRGERERIIEAVRGEFPDARLVEVPRSWEDVPAVVRDVLRIEAFAFRYFSLRHFLTWVGRVELAEPLEELEALLSAVALSMGWALNERHVFLEGQGRGTPGPNDLVVAFDPAGISLTPTEQELDALLVELGLGELPVARAMFVAARDSSTLCFERFARAYVFARDAMTKDIEGSSAAIEGGLKEMARWSEQRSEIDERVKQLQEKLAAFPAGFGARQTEIGGELVRLKNRRGELLDQCDEIAAMQPNIEREQAESVRLAEEIRSVSAGELQAADLAAESSPKVVAGLFEFLGAFQGLPSATIDDAVVPIEDIPQANADGAVAVLRRFAFTKQKMEAVAPIYGLLFAWGSCVMRYFDWQKRLGEARASGPAGEIAEAERVIAALEEEAGKLRTVEAAHRSVELQLEAACGEASALVECMKDSVEVTVMLKRRQAELVAIDVSRESALLAGYAAFGPLVSEILRPFAAVWPERPSELPRFGCIPKFGLLDLVPNVRFDDPYGVGVALAEGDRHRTLSALSSRYPSDARDGCVVYDANATQWLNKRGMLFGTGAGLECPAAEVGLKSVGRKARHKGDAKTECEDAVIRALSEPAKLPEARARWLEFKEEEGDADQAVQQQLVAVWNAFAKVVPGRIRFARFLRAARAALGTATVGTSILGTVSVLNILLDELLPSVTPFEGLRVFDELGAERDVNRLPRFRVEQLGSVSTLLLTDEVSDPTRILLEKQPSAVFVIADDAASLAAMTSSVNALLNSGGTAVLVFGCDEGLSRVRAYLATLADQLFSRSVPFGHVVLVVRRLEWLPLRLLDEGGLFVAGGLPSIRRELLWTFAAQGKLMRWEGSGGQTLRRLSYATALCAAALVCRAFLTPNGFFRASFDRAMARDALALIKAEVERGGKFCLRKVRDAIADEVFCAGVVNARDRRLIRAFVFTFFAPGVLGDAFSFARLSEDEGALWCGQADVPVQGMVRSIEQMPVYTSCDPLKVSRGWSAVVFAENFEKQLAGGAQREQWPHSGIRLALVRFLALHPTGTGFEFGFESDFPGAQVEIRGLRMLAGRVSSAGVVELAPTLWSDVPVLRARTGKRGRRETGMFMCPLLDGPEPDVAWLVPIPSSISEIELTLEGTCLDASRASWVFVTPGS